MKRTLTYPFAVIMLILMTTINTYGAAVSDLVVRVRDSHSKEGLSGAVVMIRQYGIWSTAGKDGTARLQKVPEGSCEVETSMLGYVTTTVKVTIGDRNPELEILLDEMTLALDDVVVVAQASRTGESTASNIGRQAIDHLQATSLNDLLQLLPGQIVSSNPSLNSVTQFTNRTLDKYDSNNAFGASILIDGVPVSNNAEMNSRGGTYNTAGGGTDLRSIGTDNIESVQVIRGIPSAEYGDLSSGTMIVNSKVGITDLKVKAKVFPGVKQFYAGKGLKVGKAGTVNINLDYATGKSDPRYQTDIYRRATANVIHNINAGAHAVFTTKLNLTSIHDWSGPDPAEPVQDVFNKTDENGFTFSHSGKFSTEFSLARNLKYDMAVTFKETDSYSMNLISGGVPLYDAVTEGMHDAIMLPRSYYGAGGTLGKPLNVYVKVSDSFNANLSKLKNRFNLGAEYRTDGNLGPGFYNDDPMLPLSTSGYRPRDFRAIPFLNQIVAYGEDNFEYSPAGDYPRIKGQAGLRWTIIQPGRNDMMASLSPRFNINIAFADWISVRGGYGLTEKTPSQLMMYPEVTYLDFSNVNCSKDGQWIGVYTTRIQEHMPLNLKPMRSQKIELGLDVKPKAGMSLSVIAFHEKTANGFGSTNNEWTLSSIDRWSTSDVVSSPSGLTFDKTAPSFKDTTLIGISRTANQDVHISKGVEFDFDFGKIKATNTSFYLSGAYSQTDHHSSNDVYLLPKGTTQTYHKIYYIFPYDVKSNSTRRFSSTLRVVQGIPRYKLVVSGMLQAVLYDYTKNRSDIEVPYACIYATEDGTVQKHVFTSEELADPGFSTKGFLLKDNIYPRSVYSGLAETWPSLWTVNLRITKDIAKFVGVSFYVNNLFFSQPWQNSSISQYKVEKNSSFFSFGFETYFNF